MLSNPPSKENSRNNKINSFFSKAITLFWATGVVAILILLLFFHNILDYRFKTIFSLNNVWLFILSLLSVAVLCAAYFLKKKAIDCFFKKIKTRYILIITSVLFLIQIFIFYNIYFKTGWDVKQILEASEGIASGVTDTVTQSWYYTRYPNNLLMTWIFSVIMKICNSFGLTEELTHIFVIIILQCLLYSVGSVLLFETVKGTINNPVLPFASWLLLWLHIGLNPTLTIPYSDALTVFIPITVFYIYNLTKNEKLLPLKWSLILILSFLGYKIKPQIIIILISILICESAKFIYNYNRKKKLRIAIVYSTSAILLCITVMITNFGLTRLPVKLDDEKAYGFSHFLMMGLNEEYGGAYSEPDVEFSAKFDTAKERKAANFDIAKERIKSMGLSGLTKFLAKKGLTNFGNGSYAWGLEGEFYLVIPEEKNDTISPLLRSIYYSHGENHQLFLTLQQFLWITVLIGNFGVIFIMKDKKLRSDMSAPILALVGLSMFEMIFEARARYLFNFSPIFILCAAVGWYAMLKFFISIIYKLKSKNSESEVIK